MDHLCQEAGHDATTHRLSDRTDQSGCAEARYRQSGAAADLCIAPYAGRGVDGWRSVLATMGSAAGLNTWLSTSDGAALTVVFQHAALKQRSRFFCRCYRSRPGVFLGLWR